MNGPISANAKGKGKKVKKNTLVNGHLTVADTLSNRGVMYYRQALILNCLMESEEDKASYEGSRASLDQAQALAELKFTYIVSCQLYGAHKKSKNNKERRCYTDILNLMLMYPSIRVAYIDEMEETKDRKCQKVYYSVLVKGGEKYDEEIYRIKLPGPPTEIGEGKPENQNHAIIFTRGEALQIIDMNQCFITWLVYVKSGDQLCDYWPANFGKSFKVSPNLFAIIVRFHYGFNSTLRQGFITHHEYIQVGKGCDMGMNEIALFEAKVANGNGEQTLSRDVYRLGQQFDFFRMLSFYFTTVGFYFSSMFGALLELLMIMENGLEKGFHTAFGIWNFLSNFNSNTYCPQVQYLYGVDLLYEICLFYFLLSCPLNEPLFSIEQPFAVQSSIQWRAPNSMILARSTSRLDPTSGALNNKLPRFLCAPSIYATSNIFSSRINKPDEERNPLPLDEDLPGMGQYYCLHCDRYFSNVGVRDEHFKTKKHKKRVKQMMGPAPHTQLDAELAAGMGMPDNGLKLMSM
ncbi:hypothetical protein RJT34_19719 [Clitoria ternatea]|uniref:C2H2-type domain-containing protein n=1 Tax=Clitoria ternatea TaxID=43366 RepID=A0AAN9IRJ5_CLITE